MLSCIIPSYKDPLLQKTIDSLLENAEGEIEIIAVLDGYWPTVPLKNDKRLKILHLGKNRGMREAINAGILMSTGEWIMRMDEHQIVGKGYDKVLTRDCSDNMVMTLRRYFLDVVKWEVMDIPPVDSSKLVIAGEPKKFAGSEWKSHAEKNKDVMIYETMAMQGSMWCMKRSHWDEVIGRLQTEGYGPLIQDSHEIVFKTWKNGGRLMVNKNSWHAHKHRDFPRTHNNGTPENPAKCNDGYAYALSVWGDYYKEIKEKWGI
jgi:hypothetical protein